MGIEGVNTNNNTSENRAFFNETVFKTILVAGEKIVTPDMQPVREASFVNARHTKGSRDVANQWGITPIAVTEYNRIITTELDLAKSGIQKSTKKIQKIQSKMEKLHCDVEQYKSLKNQLNQANFLKIIGIPGPLNSIEQDKIANLEKQVKRFEGANKKYENYKVELKKQIEVLAHHQVKSENYSNIKSLKFGKLSLQDAELITYQIFYKRWGVDKLPRQIQGPVTDHLYARGPKRGAMPLKNVVFHGHVPLRARGSGFDQATMKAVDEYVKKYGEEQLLAKLRGSMDASFNNVANNNSDKSGFRKGWLNRNEDIFAMWSNKFQDYTKQERAAENARFAYNEKAFLDLALLPQDGLQSERYQRNKYYTELIKVIYPDQIQPSPAYEEKQDISWFKSASDAFSSLFSSHSKYAMFLRPEDAKVEKKT